jgi:hypothetical protein
MRDTANDGWSGNYFDGFGFRQTMSGSSDSYNFSTECNGTSPETNSTEVTDTVIVGGGSSKSEVRWKLVCDGNQIVGET